MTRNDYFLAALLGLAYIVLIGLLAGITVTWGDFIPGNDFWGQSNARAIAYMQIYHSIGVALAALPIGLAIAWRFKKDWVRPALIAAIIGSSFMLIDQIRGIWYLSQHDIVPEVNDVVSGIIDVLKTPVILFIVTVVLTRTFIANRASA